MRFSQHRIETLLAHAACLATLALGEPMSARWALELDSGRRVTLSIGINWGSFRPALNALLAEDVLALHAHTGHERPRMGRKKRVGLAIAGEVPNERRSVDESEQTTVTIRLAIAASKQVASVRGVTVLSAPRRPAYFSSFALS